MWRIPSSNLPHGRSEAGSSTPRHVEDNADIDDLFFNFSGAFNDSSAPQLHSLGGLLLDLGFFSEDGMDEIEASLNSVHESLINQVVGEVEINAARENIDEFEREAGIDTSLL